MIPARQLPPSGSDHARQRAERLLAMAINARRKGHTHLADQLTLRAMQYLEEANGELAPPPIARAAAPIVAQQQQQQPQPFTKPHEGDDKT